MAIPLTKKLLQDNPHLMGRVRKYLPTDQQQPEKTSKQKPTPSKTSPGKFPLTDRMEIAVFWFMLGMVVMSGMIAYVRLI